MNILITGGLGYVGSWLTRALTTAGHRVTTFSRSPRPQVLPDLDFERVTGDILDIDDVDSVVSRRQWDVIIHLAAAHGSTADSRQMLLVNTLGTRNVLEAQQTAGSTAHFIYFSTFHVYGRTHGMITEESDADVPLSDYAATHLFAESYVKQFHKLFQLPYTILRLSNTYGAPLDMEGEAWNLAVNQMATMAHRDKRITLMSNTDEQRDYIWLGDVCYAVAEIIRTGAANRVLNLSGGNSLTSRQTAQIVARVAQQRSGQRIVLEAAAQISTGRSELRFTSIALKDRISFRPSDNLELEVSRVLDLLSQEK